VVLGVDELCGMVQPQRGTARVREHDPLVVGGCGLQVVPQLAEPGVQPGPVGLGQLGHVDHAPGVSELVGEPALPVRGRGTHVAVEQQNVRHAVILAPAPHAA
jgi:hypothetical protein